MVIVSTVVWLIAPLPPVEAVTVTAVVAGVVSGFPLLLLLPHEVNVATELEVDRRGTACGSGLRSRFASWEELRTHARERKCFNLKADSRLSSHSAASCLLRQHFGQKLSWIAVVTFDCLVEARTG
jgi:hypothetical protein